MRNQVFAMWDEVGGDVQEFTLPAANQKLLDQIMDSLPDTDAQRVIVDLADLWNAEEKHSDGLEVGTARTHLTISNGTHLMVSAFGRDMTYAVAWHPEDQDAQRDTLIAFSKEGEIDEEDEEDLRLADLIREIAQKHKEAIEM